MDRGCTGMKILLCYYLIRNLSFFRFRPSAER